MTGRASKPVLDDTIAALGRELGDRVSLNYALREQHSHDESWFEPGLPDAVCFPESVEEISTILRVCNEAEVPVIPFGTGTGVAGQINAIRGGISLDLSRMNRILQVRPEDFDCTVEAGVTRNQLNKYIHDTGLFFPVDPGADASLGGMASTRASGTNAVRYGTMCENVVNVTAVLADGRVFKTGSRARKSSAGYDLTHLFVGAEGTLGVIANLSLRLHGRPASSATTTAQFGDLKGAVDSVIETLQLNIPVASIELIDRTLVKAMNDYSKTSFPINDSLFVQFHGSDAEVKDCAQMFEQICSEHNCLGISWTQNSEEEGRIWQARHNAAWAFLAQRPNAKNLSTDVCVPLSKLAECINETRTDLDQNCSLITTIAGHVGDGNFHVVFLVDPTVKDEVEQVKAFYDRLVTRALDFGGTCTGEHGVGIQKRHYLTKEFGETGVEMMKAIKHTYDPNNIMNPGKKLPD